jgi:hypothetical protein
MGIANGITGIVDNVGEGGGMQSGKRKLGRGCFWLMAGGWIEEGFFPQTAGKEWRSSLRGLVRDDGFILWGNCPPRKAGSTTAGKPKSPHARTACGAPLRLLDSCGLGAQQCCAPGQTTTRINGVTWIFSLHLVVWVVVFLWRLCRRPLCSWRGWLRRRRACPRHGWSSFLFPFSSELP